MKYLSEKMIKEELARRLRGSIDEGIWQYLVEKYYVQEVLSGESSIEGLKREYKRLERIKHAPRAEFKMKKPFRVLSSTPSRKFEVLASSLSKAHCVFDDEDQVFSKVLAFELSQHHDIKQFRKRVLKDKLLSPLEFEVLWVFYKAWEAREELFKMRAIARQIVKRGYYEADGDRKTSGEPPEYVKEFIKYTKEIIEGPEKIREELKEEISILGWEQLFSLEAIEELEDIAITTTEIFPLLLKEDIIRFVLTGELKVPVAHFKISLFPVGNNYSRSSVQAQITCDLRMTPLELSQYFSALRTAILNGGHIKPLSEKHKRLAVFASGRGEKKWRELFEEWNVAFPKWQYKTLSNFIRDAVQARDRILGVAKAVLPQGQEVEFKILEESHESPGES